MKILRYSLCLLALIVWATSSTHGQERQRRINKTFDVGPSTTLKVENQFGRVHINTWDKSQIQLEVVIRAEMRNDERSQEFVDRVDVRISESSAMVSLRTDFGGKMNSRKGESFSVDYTMSMPSSGDLEVRNKFGDIYVGDLTGSLNVDLKYGKMRADKITGKSDIEIGFGGANIDELGDAELEIKYSDLRVLAAGDVNLDQQFSDIRMDVIKDMDLRSKYGSVEIGILNSVDGSAGFTDFEIDEVSSRVVLDMEYVGGFTIGKLKSGFSEVRIDARFTSMDISVEDGSGGQFDGVFKFCELHNRGGEMDLNYVVKDMNRSEYKGVFGNGGSSRISVDSGYGDLKLYFN